MAEEQLTSPLSDIKAFEHVISWLRGERYYTLEKFGSSQDKQHVRDFEDKEKDNEIAWWTQQLRNYFYRAWVLGLDTPVGRQALAKFVSTGAGMLAAAVQEYGELPKPGVPSGEIEQ